MNITLSHEKNSPILAHLGAALWAESRKLLRSRIIWVTAGAFVFITLICGLFMFILKDPENARQLGLLSAKAQMFGGTADWTGFYALILVIAGYAGLVIFGFIFVWIFGREFSNKTVYDFLSIPTSRLTIVVAKCITAAVWCAILLLVVFLSMLVIGGLLGLPGGSTDIILDGFGKLLVTGALVIVLSTPFALIASLTRGYLPAVGGLFIVIILSQVFESLGYSQWFPWSIPSLVSGSAEMLTGQVQPEVGIGSFILVAAISLAGFVATGLWWKYADQA